MLQRLNHSRIDCAEIGRRAEFYQFFDVSNRLRPRGGLRIV